MEFNHRSVLLNECIENLNIKPDGIYVDGTAGGGGHSFEIASRMNDKGLLICIDKDTEALKASKQRLSILDKNIIFVHANFFEIKKVLSDNAINSVDGILLDLGVSSYQLDNAGRGFSYQADAILDMRMDATQGITAKEVVNTYEQQRLTQVIYDYGEERWAKRIAEFICKHRIEKEIETTGELVEIIKAAIPAGARRDGPHPAKRTFQAIRIEVNNELGILKPALQDGVKALNVGGKFCVITFHSLEDRIIKQTFALLEGKCICPPGLPVCGCGNVAFGRALRKGIEPTAKEIESNPRARSAKLRVFERK